MYSCEHTHHTCPRYIHTNMYIRTYTVYVDTHVHTPRVYTIQTHTDIHTIHVQYTLTRTYTSHTYDEHGHHTWTQYPRVCTYLTTHTRTHGVHTYTHTECVYGRKRIRERSPVVRPRVSSVPVDSGHVWCRSGTDLGRLGVPLRTVGPLGLVEDPRRGRVPTRGGRPDLNPSRAPPVPTTTPRPDHRSL